MDTTTKRRSHESILSSFKSREVDILIGTQMIAKGLDYPNVTLVGVISADTALNLPDFRSSEWTFSLLTQVAGRAGRGDIQGEVIIQTYAPEHYSIQAASSQDYHLFYKKEMPFRQTLNYPPFTHLINITIKGKDGGRVVRAAEKLGDKIREKSPLSSTSVLGPAPSPLPKIRGEHRWQIVLKGKKPSKLHELLKLSLKDFSIPQGVKLRIDVDPIGML